jgi:hypothetical protein
MDEPKSPTPRKPPGSGEKITAHPVSIATALAKNVPRSRHSAITNDLNSYLRYKVWTAKIRNAFDEPK